MRSCLKEKVAAPVYKTQDYGRRGSARLITRHPAKVGTDFTDRRRSLGRYNSLADSGQGVYLFVSVVSIWRLSDSPIATVYLI
jgi:hypothetical protein